MKAKGEAPQPLDDLLALVPGEAEPREHPDLYPLGDADELFDLGFNDYLSGPGVVAIEWPEKALPLLPCSGLTRVGFELLPGDRRRLLLEKI